MNERSSKFAVWMTILWLGGIFSFYILGLFERPTSFSELGDFLAGVFAPVVFVWLVYGYFQNSEVFQVQNKDKIHSVRPDLILEDGYCDKLVINKKVICHNFSMVLNNIGLGPALNVSVRHDYRILPIFNINILNELQDKKIEFSISSEFDFGQSKIVDLADNENTKDVFQLIIYITFYDKFFNTYEKKVVLLAAQVVENSYKVVFLRNNQMQFEMLDNK